IIDAWTADDRFILFSLGGAGGLFVLPLVGDRKSFSYMPDGGAGPGRLSPDGRWIAYFSNESGRQEVYVVSFPKLTGKWQVSTAGGAMPLWRRDGREIFYLRATDRNLMAVAVNGQGAEF